MPKVCLCSSPVVEVNKLGGVVYIVTSPMDDVLPRETVECADLPAIAAAFADFTGRLKATGMAAHASVYFPRQPARKPRGFDAARLDAYINTESMVAAV